VLVLVVFVGMQAFTSNSTNDTDGLTIAVSIYPLQFAAERVLGDLGTVVNIGEGRDPHDVQLSVENTRTMLDADLVVLQGAGLEPWGDDMEEQLEAEDVPFFVAAEHLELREGGHHDEHGDEHDGEHEKDDHDEAHEHEHEDEHDGDMHEAGEEHGHDDEHEHEDEYGHEDEHGYDHGAFDPHTWLDPPLFSETIEHLTEEIVALDPENATTYEANAAELQAELAALDTEFATRLASCAVDEVIVSHDAYGYMANRYGIEMHAIGGLSTQDMPSVTTLAELKEEAAEGVGAILLEKNSVAAYGEALARDTGLQTLSINPAAFDIPEGGDYVSVMRSNLDSLATALRCNEG